MKIRKNDKVIVISGKDKGKESTVEKAFPELAQVLVKGVNIVKKHKKKQGKEEGGIISMEKPINISSVMLICGKCNKGVKIAMKIVEGKKHRVCKKCGNAI